MQKKVAKGSINAEEASEGNHVNSDYLQEKKLFQAIIRNSQKQTSILLKKNRELKTEVTALQNKYETKHSLWSNQLAELKHKLKRRNRLVCLFFTSFITMCLIFVMTIYIKNY